MRIVGNDEPELWCAGWDQRGKIDEGWSVDHQYGSYADFYLKDSGGFLFLPQSFSRVKSGLYGTELKILRVPPRYLVVSSINKWPDPIPAESNPFEDMSLLAEQVLSCPQPRFCLAFENVGRFAHAGVCRSDESDETSDRTYAADPCRQPAMAHPLQFARNFCVVSRGNPAHPGTVRKCLNIPRNAILPLRPVINEDMSKPQVHTEVSLSDPTNNLTEHRIPLLRASCIMETSVQTTLGLLIVPADIRLACALVRLESHPRAIPVCRL